MKLRNETDIHESVIREVISFVKMSRVTNFEITVRGSKIRQIHGIAYPHGVRHGGPDTQSTIVNIPLNVSAYPMMMKPYQYGQLKGKQYFIADRIEALVYIIAHEIRHLWQGRMKNKAGYFWGSRGRYSEIDTESWAIHCLREWRRRND